MLERIVSFIERIVVALETIAKAPAVCAGNQTTAALTPAAVTGLGHSEGSAKIKERDTNNLVQQAQVPAQIPAPTFGNATATDFMAPAQPAIAPPTREVVGNKLIELATISRDEAVKVLDSFGGAKKLSDIAESDYLALLATINKAIAATKAA